MFCDQTKVTVTAGKGGDGGLSFHREKFIAKGGPDGGNGGRGGNVLFEATDRINSLIVLHTKKKFSAKKGTPGKPKECHGAAAEDLILMIPVGTQIFDTESGNKLADLEVDGDQYLCVHGGRGGFGNAHFTTSVRQAPRFAELGEPGESRTVSLELKLVADIGIIGLPSAGKSTFISAVTSARPKTGDFPFTTLVPNLGVAELPGERSVILCDMPGLIEGASAGKGLGHQFLKHVARNRVLLHLVDITAENPAKNYQIIRKELEKYQPDLLQKPEIVVFSKGDLLGSDTDLRDMVVREFTSKTGVSSFFHCSSVSRKGLSQVLEKAYVLIEGQKEQERKSAPEMTDQQREKQVFSPHLATDPKAFFLTPEEEGFRVTGQRIEQIVVQTDFTNHEAVLRVRDVLRKMGIESELLRQGAGQDTPIFIGKKSLGFQPNLFGKRKR